MGYTKEQRIINSMKSRAEFKTPIATEMFLPNHSGIASHPEATGTFVKKSGDTMTGNLTISNPSNSKLILTSPDGNKSYTVTAANTTVNTVSVGVPLEFKSSDGRNFFNQTSVNNNLRIRNSSGSDAILTHTTNCLDLDTPLNILDSNDSFLLTGILTIDAPLKINATSSGAGEGIEISRYSNDNAAGSFFGLKARGSASSLSAVQDDDGLFILSGVGHDGTDYHEAGRITFQVDDTVSNNTVKGRLVFSTSAGANVTERMRIDNTGQVGIGTTSPSCVLDVAPNTDAKGIIGRAYVDGGSIQTDVVSLGHYDFQSTSGRGIAFSSAGRTLVNGSTTQGIHFQSNGSDKAVMIGADWHINSAVAGNATFDINGSLGVNLVSKTSNYTATSTDHTMICSGALTITLPTATSSTGRIYVVKNVGNLTVTVSGSDLIDGVVSRDMTTIYDSFVMQSDGTTWHLLSAL